MSIYNSLKINNINPGDKLYLVRYSQKNHPDFIFVWYKDINENKISYVTDKGITKKINVEKAVYRLFENEDEMSRSLYDCFVRRDILFFGMYKDLFQKSQENRPEIWV